MDNNFNNNGNFNNGYNMPPQQPMYPQNNGTNGKAVAALVLGIVGIRYRWYRGRLLYSNYRYYIGYSWYRFRQHGK